MKFSFLGNLLCQFRGNILSDHKTTSILIFYEDFYNYYFWSKPKKSGDTFFLKNDIQSLLHLKKCIPKPRASPPLPIPHQYKTLVFEFLSTVALHHIL